MSTDVSPTRRAVSEASAFNNMADPKATSSSGLTDAKKLKARLYSFAPKQAQVNNRSLTFRKPTYSQIKRMGIPGVPILEPLVCLK